MLEQGRWLHVTSIPHKNVISVHEVDKVHLEPYLGRFRMINLHVNSAQWWWKLQNKDTNFNRFHHYARYIGRTQKDHWASHHIVRQNQAINLRTSNSTWKLKLGLPVTYPRWYKSNGNIGFEGVIVTKMKIMCIILSFFLLCLFMCMFHNPDPVLGWPPHPLVKWSDWLEFFGGVNRSIFGSVRLGEVDQLLIVNNSSAFYDKFDKEAFEFFFLPLVRPRALKWQVNNKMAPPSIK